MKRYKLDRYGANVFELTYRDPLSHLLFQKTFRTFPELLAYLNINEEMKPIRVIEKRELLLKERIAEVLDVIKE